MKNTQILREKLDLSKIKSIGDVLCFFDKESRGSRVEKILSNPESFYLDPDMGGGQFLSELIRDQRSRGFSDENISRRIFGFSSDVMGMNYAINKENLIGNFEVLDFISLEVRNNFLFFTINGKHYTMNFDAILGNPPYQSPGVEIGQSQIYPSFIEKGISILKDGGILSYVTPPTFLKDKVSCMSGAKITTLNTNSKKYFQNVGTSAVSYIMEKTNEERETKIISNDSQFSVKLEYGGKLIPVGLMKEESFSIIDKIYSIDTEGRFNFKRNETPFPENAAFIRRQNRNRFFNALKTGEGFDIKVSSDYTTTERADDKISLLNSKLFSYFYLCYSTSPFITLGFINSVPFPPEMFSTMNDSQIFEFYGITKEEIEIIEESIK
jgi:hypothetical protein